MTNDGSFRPPHGDGPWLPPRPDVVQPSGPPIEPHADMALSDPAGPSPSRRRMIVTIVAAVVVLVAGLGAVFAVRDDGGSSVVVEDARDGDPADAEAFSLPAAASQASDATTVRYDMEISGPPFGSITIEGGIDTAAGLMDLRMDLGSLGLAPPGAGTVEVVFDTSNQVIYMDASALGDVPTNGASWLAIDVAAMAAQSGVSVDELEDQFGANPLDAAAIFESVDPADIADLGPTEIDGLPVRQYRVTLDLAEALDSLPTQLGDPADLGGLDEIVYDVWVTEDNRIRRVAFELDTAGQQVGLVMNMYEVGEPLDITVPSPDDVFDLSELVGG